MSLASKVGVGEDIVRHKFILAVPFSIKLVVAAQIELDIGRLGKMFDDLLYFNRQGNSPIQQISRKQQLQQLGDMNKTKNYHSLGVSTFKERPKTKHLPISHIFC